MIPNMMLQPYIENAIWHGLSNKKETGGSGYEYMKMEMLRSLKWKTMASAGKDRKN
jgi:hypothetical protein